MQLFLLSLTNLIDWKTLYIFLIIFLITFCCVFFKLDESVYRFAQGQSDFWITIFKLPFSIGVLVFIFILTCLVFNGNENKMQLSSFILAILICLLVNGVMKVLIGRIGPHSFLVSSLSEAWTTFTFNPFEGKFLGAFPSGHTMIASSVMVSIVSCSSNKVIQILIIIWGIWANVAMVLGAYGNYHWLSDGLAGFVLGAYISLMTHQQIQ